MADLTPKDGTRVFGDDGTPHLVYFSEQADIAFVYDTSFGDDIIAVQRGGYGEPVVDAFDAFEFDDNWGDGPSIAKHLERFAAVCEGYLTRMTSQSEIEKAMVEGFRAGVNASIIGRKYDGSDQSPRAKAYEYGLRARRQLETDGLL